MMIALAACSVRVVGWNYQTMNGDETDLFWGINFPYSCLYSIPDLKRVELT